MQVFESFIEFLDGYLGSAVYFPFLVAADVRRNVGQSPFDDAFIETHVDTITALLAR